MEPSFWDETFAATEIERGLENTRCVFGEYLTFTDLVSESIHFSILNYLMISTLKILLPGIQLFVISVAKILLYYLTIQSAYFGYKRITEWRPMTGIGMAVTQ